VIEEITEVTTEEIIEGTTEIEEMIEEITEEITTETIEEVKIEDRTEIIDVITEMGIIEVEKRDKKTEENKYKNE
jgi:hypothetical protein